MEEAVGEFGAEEKRRLSRGMAPKQITVCEDETFHPETCLVAIEPVSNFILLEKYSSSRKAEEWTASMKEAIGVPGEVIQSTSDEGRGVCHHVKEDLGAHHCPDVFHVQNDVVKATSGALASRSRKAEQALEMAGKEVGRHREDKEAYLNNIVLNMKHIRTVKGSKILL